MAAAAKASDLYEPNDNIDANLDPTDGLTGGPVIWADLCTGAAKKIRRVKVNWRKGSKRYTLIPGAVIEVPEFDTKDGGSTDTDTRQSDPGKWGREIAARAWAFGVEYASKNGPVIDAQLALETWDEANGVFRVIKGCLKAIKCPNNDPGTRENESADLRDRVIDQLLLAIDRRDLRVERFIDKFDSIADGMAKVMGVSFNASVHAITLANSVSANASQEREKERQFVKDLVQMQTTGETIQAVVKEVAPHLEDLFNNFSAGAGKAPYSKIAKELLESITDDQRGKADAVGVAELFADLETMLKKMIASKKDDECRALMWAIGPKLNEAHAVIKPILSERQQGLVLALLKRAGLV